MSKATTASATAADPTVSVFRGDTDVALDPWPTIAPERVISGAPSQQGKVLFRDPAKRYSIGVWECTPGSFPVSYAGTEMGHVLRGHATITNAESGEARDIGPGDHFFLVFGSSVIWNIHETFRKAYVMYELEGDEERIY